MNPIDLKLSLTDVNTVLEVLLEAPVPGKVWLNAWFSLKTQRDAALTPPATAPAEPETSKE
jgi:hypothetical protein